jgi:anti-anti-sigma factor
MRAQQHAAPLLVVRSEAEPGRVGLRLIGELDVNTVAVLETELAGSREQSPPAVIDLSELRFLDLIGLRALLRAGRDDGVPTTRLVGAEIRAGTAIAVSEDAPDDAYEVGEVAANENGNAASATNHTRRAATARNGDAP